jgi:hypothetical protein
VDLQHALWWLSVAAECAALAALVVRHISRPYAWFAAYLGFAAVRGIVLHELPGAPHTRVYAICWMATAPALLALLVAATLEIVAKVPEHYRGFGSFGRQKLRRLLQFAIAVALVSSVIEAGGPSWTLSTRYLLAFVVAIDRLITTALAVYLVLVAIFVSRVPVPFRRNLNVHSRLFASYLALQSGAMLWANAVAGGRGTAAVNAALTGGSTLLFLLWAALLTRKGEALPPRKAMTPAEIAANVNRERALEEAAGRYSGERLR